MALYPIAAGTTWLIAWYLPAPTWVGAVLIGGIHFARWQAHRSCSPLVGEGV